MRALAMLVWTFIGIVYAVGVVASIVIGAIMFRTAWVILFAPLWPLVLLSRVLVLRINENNRQEGHRDA